MSSEPLTLETGPDFALKQLEPGAEQWVFTTFNENQSRVELVAAGHGLKTRRVIGVLPGLSLLADAIVASPRRGKVYVAAAPGICEFPLEGGEPSIVGGLPDLPVASQSDVQQAYGHSEAHWGSKRRSPQYHWVLTLDEESNSLFALSSQEGALPHLIEISLVSRSIVSQTRMPGSCGRIRVDAARRRIVLPFLKDGPQVLDFAGNRLATLGSFAGRFPEAAFRPNGTVVLGESQRGLWVWDWENDQLNQLADDSCQPECDALGTIFYMRTSAELWMLEKNSQPKLVVRALGNEGGTEHERTRSWAMRPRLAASGRFVLAQLSAVLKKEAGDVPTHDAVVVDLSTHRVQQTPRFFQHSLAGIP